MGMVSTVYLVLALHDHYLIKCLSKRGTRNWAIPFCSIQGCGRQFPKFIFGADKKEIPRGGTKNHPYETNFLGMTPLENVPRLALTV